MKRTHRKLMTALCGTLISTSTFAQTIYTWTGAGDGTNLITTNNWNPVGQPSGSTQDTAQWDGATSSNLTIWYGSTALPGTGFGTSGINIILTTNQKNSVTLVSPVAQSATIGIFAVTNFSGSTPLVFGDSTTNRFNIIGRPAGSLHFLENYSTTPVLINPSVRWQAGGGTSYTLEFGGSGNFVISNYLRNDNNSGATTITVDGPGTTTWVAAGAAGNSAIGPVVVNGGTLVLGSSGLLANQAISNFATLSCPFAIANPGRRDCGARFIASQRRHSGAFGGQHLHGKHGNRQQCDRDAGGRRSAGDVGTAWREQ
jgi:hypothetical protein